MPFLRRLIACAILLLVFSGEATAASIYPECKISTTASPNAISSGERSTVTVTIKGDTVAQAKPVPQSLVFVLDFSGSMGGDVEKDLKVAVNGVLGKLRKADDVASIVVFRDTVKTSGPLTNNFAALSNVLNGEGAGGGTNFIVGIEAANKLLFGATTPARTALFFSDGFQADKSSEVLKRVRGLSAESIVYHTIGLGNRVDDGLLQEMARLTGGTYLFAPKSGDLAKKFTDVYQTTSFSPRNVVVREHVTPDFVVWKDSLVVSEAGTNSIDEFNSELARLRKGFESTGKITFPAIDFLPAGKSFSFSYEVVSPDCEDKDKLVDVRMPGTSIDYRDGSPVRKITYFDAVKITKLKCGVRLTKKWLEPERRLTISLHNSYHNGLRDLEIADVLNPVAFGADTTREASDGIAVFANPVTKSDEITWKVDDVAYQEALSWVYHVYDRLPPTTGPGVLAIESNDKWCMWKIDVHKFDITAAIPEYQQFKKDIAAGVLSPTVHAQFVRVLLGVTIPGSATVGTPSPEMVKRGYKYVVEFAPSPTGRPGQLLPMITAPTPGSAKTHGPETRHEWFTGRFFIKEAENKFEFFAEQHGQEILEHLNTSKYYQPGN